MTNTFGSATTIFDFQTMNTLLQSGYHDNYTEAKKYFSTYHAKSYDDQYYVLEPDGNGGDIKLYDSSMMNNRFTRIETKVSVQVGNKTVSDKADIKDWFLKHNYSYFAIDQDPYKPRFYQDPTTQRNYLNISKGFKHKHFKPYNSYPDEIKQKVQLILAHIKGVWNSGDEKAYMYVLTWFAHALTSRKVQTALFLKSGEGTGKSIIIDFLIDHVIGRDLGLSTSSAKKLMQFNSHLQGKTLLVLEELPASSKSEWTSLSEVLRDLITSSTMEFEAKYENIKHMKNIISMIIITNNENTLKFGKDARRYFMPDISHDKTGNFPYFDELKTACDDPLVGECFYMMLKEHCEKYPDFNEACMPMTDQKLSMKARNITPILQYFKDEYIMKKRDIEKIKLSSEYSTFKEYCELNAVKACTSIQCFNKCLSSDIHLLSIKESTKSKTLHIFPLPHESLLEFYIKKGFWDERYDDFCVHAEEVKPVKDIEETTKLQEENTKLKAEIEKLKAENENLKKIIENANKRKKIKSKIIASPVFIGEEFSLDDGIEEL